MDPHNDFDKHDRPPYDIAPATNTAYAAMRQQRDELLAALKSVVYSAHPRKSEHPEMFAAWQLAHSTIAKAEGESQETTEQRCDGRYPVPQTAPPRDEPFPVTYRCDKPKGHDGPHGPEF